MDDWMESLRRTAAGVRPTLDAHGRIGAELGRRRRTRRVAVGAVAAVVAVVGGTAGISGTVTGNDDAPGPTGRTSAADPTPTDPTKPIDPATFTCPTEHRVFTEEPPEPDPATIQADKMAYANTTGRSFEGFEVQHLDIYAYAGVYALVTGDLAKARRELGALGVDRVERRDPAVDEVTQLERMIGERLDELLRTARQTSRQMGGQGSASIALWREAVAVVVQWKAPVPGDIQDLADIPLPGGGRIFVDEVAYSRLEMDVAQTRDLPLWLDATDRRNDWSTAYACGDFSGLVVGMTPESLEDADVPALQRGISEAIGMPAYVVPEERPVPLTP